MVRVFLRMKTIQTFWALSLGLLFLVSGCADNNRRNARFQTGGGVLHPAGAIQQAPLRNYRQPAAGQQWLGDTGQRERTPEQQAIIDANREIAEAEKQASEDIRNAEREAEVEKIKERKRQRIEAINAERDADIARIKGESEDKEDRFSWRAECEAESLSVADAKDPNDLDGNPARCEDHLKRMGREYQWNECKTNSVLVGGKIISLKMLEQMLTNLGVKLPGKIKRFLSSKVLGRREHNVAVAELIKAYRIAVEQAAQNRQVFPSGISIFKMMYNDDRIGKKLTIDSSKDPKSRLLNWPQGGPLSTFAVIRAGDHEPILMDATKSDVLTGLTNSFFFPEEEEGVLMYLVEGFIRVPEGATLRLASLEDRFGNPVGVPISTFIFVGGTEFFISTNAKELGQFQREDIVKEFSWDSDWRHLAMVFIAHKNAKPRDIGVLANHIVFDRYGDGTSLERLPQDIFQIVPDRQENFPPVEQRFFADVKMEHGTVEKCPAEEQVSIVQPVKVSTPPPPKAVELEVTPVNPRKGNADVSNNAKIALTELIQQNPGETENNGLVRRLIQSIDGLKPEFTKKDLESLIEYLTRPNTIDPPPPGGRYGSGSFEQRYANYSGGKSIVVQLRRELAKLR